MAHRHGSRDDVQVLVDDLAAELGRSVVVNDPSMHLLHASRHYADEDPVRVRAVLQRDPAPEVADYVLGLGVTAWPGPGVVPANPGLELRARLCVPARHGRRVLALLLVIDADATLTPAETARIAEVAGTLAARLDARDTAAARADTERERRVADLLGDDPDARETARRELVASGVPDRPAVVVTVLDATPTDATPPDATPPDAAPTDAPGVPQALRTALDARIRRERPASVGTVDGSRARLVQAFVSPPPQDTIDEAGRQLAAAARRGLGPTAEICVGLGAVAAGLAGAWRSARQASLAARGARLVARHGGIARWADVADHATLLGLPDAALTRDLVPDGLWALVAHEAGPRLRPTLEAFLDEAGSVPRTAARLHLHRTSLYYRLRQIAEITGADLDDGRRRLELHQGLRALALLDGGDAARRR